MFQPRRHQRRPIRLPYYDYRRAGAYFVSTNAHKRRYLFGQVYNDTMIPNDFGMIVDRAWLSIPEHFTNVVLDEHIVMPNHFHGILWITHDVRGGAIRDARGRDILIGGLDQNDLDDGIREFGIPQLAAEFDLELRRFGCPIPDSLSTIVGTFKASAPNEIHLLERGVGVKVWQARFHERVIRNRSELLRIRRYIRNNPHMWTGS